MLDDDIMRACARPEFVARFWSRVAKSDGCWLWTGRHRNGTGYGGITVGYSEALAHRISWCLTHGEIPRGLCVLHRCDVPLCVRPDHLFIGTHADNAQDRDKKGRHNRPFGSRHGQSKLTEDQVVEIRALRGVMLQREIAARYGVNQTIISDIFLGYTWTHVP